MRRCSVQCSRYVEAQIAEGEASDDERPERSAEVTRGGERRGHKRQKSDAGGIDEEVSIRLDFGINIGRKGVIIGVKTKINNTCLKQLSKGCIPS